MTFMVSLGEGAERLSFVIPICEPWELLTPFPRVVSFGRHAQRDICTELLAMPPC